MIHLLQNIPRNTILPKILSSHYLPVPSSYSWDYSDVRPQNRSGVSLYLLSLGLQLDARYWQNKNSILMMCEEYCWTCSNVIIAIMYQVAAACKQFFQGLYFYDSYSKMKIDCLDQLPDIVHSHPIWIHVSRTFRHTKTLHGLLIQTGGRWNGAKF